MLAADALAVFAGIYLTTRLPMVWIRRAAAALFFVFGLTIIFKLLGQ
jgi:putative Ca2+/H+ antiporter (TMEM165/GDT1 family)